MYVGNRRLRRQVAAGNLGPLYLLSHEEGVSSAGWALSRGASGRDRPRLTPLGRGAKIM